MFPTINHISDLLPHVEHNNQIRVMSVESGYTVISYLVQDEDTFTGVKELWERECRGITFHADGRIASRTLTKFFNIGQRDDVQPEKLHWPSVTRIMVKRDGSMVTPVLTGVKQFKFKTKKTFSSKEAIAAGDHVNSVPSGTQWICDLLESGMTPTFEFTSPRFPIVLVYEKDELTLLHIRENVSGRYLSEQEIRDLNPPFPIVENVMGEFLDCNIEDGGIITNHVSWAKLKAYAARATGVEGVVIQFDQDMVKLKTVWYCDLHHAVTFTRWRDIARAVVANASDDLKGAFTLTGRDIAPILKVEQTIKAKIEQAEAIVKAIVSAGLAASYEQKTMALEHKGNPLFSQIMAAFKGRELDWMAWYEKNHLDTDWSLEVVTDTPGFEVAK